MLAASRIAESISDLKLRERQHHMRSVFVGGQSKDGVVISSAARRDALVVTNTVADAAHQDSFKKPLSEVLQN